MVEASLKEVLYFFVRFLLTVLVIRLITGFDKDFTSVSSPIIIAKGCSGSISSNTTFMIAMMGIAIKVPGNPHKALPVITPMIEARALIWTLEPMIFGDKILLSI